MFIQLNIGKQNHVDLFHVRELKWVNHCGKKSNLLMFIKVILSDLILIRVSLKDNPTLLCQKTLYNKLIKTS